MLEIYTNKNIQKKFKPSKYLVVSVLLHTFVILMFLCPHIFFKAQRKFISNNIMSVQILVQQNVQEKKNKKDLLKKDILKEDFSGVPKEKSTPSDNNTSKEEISESIIVNQNVANIKYNILKSSEPQYPNIVKRLNLLQQVVVKTRLLIDKEGNIAKIEFLESNIDESLEQFFQKEILTALNTWQFSTVTLDDRPVKIYFYKNFVFQNA